jgi:thiol-disulfide isomerase/thioredoxin
MPDTAPGVRRRFRAADFGVAALICGAAAIAADAGGVTKAPDFDGAIGWLNSAPLNSKALRGRVVLVNFWTYSCINSLRELPYIKAWAQKYKDAGLVVVGVHAPEFGFERDAANVKLAVEEFKIPYAVPIDSNHAIWQAFRNQYWPADYFIDAKGAIRYRHFGEGEYDRSEHVIQSLLKENGAAGLDESAVHIVAEGPESPRGADVKSPETYTGYARTENFASVPPLAQDSQKTYSLPVQLALNQWGLGGLWRSSAESTRLETAPGKLVFRFHSRDLHMVLGPSKDGKPVRFKVKLNNAAPGDNHGSDSAADGTGEVRRPRMYQLIRQNGPIQDGTFEIDFLDPGIEVFSFTFG